ncbi:MAG: hypothetical protein QOF71_2641 [Candidatus Eremiobacteraeota bacterium]|jgi:hypothetical protein|nr:hypothetical protein [Candidatus Eremiobacteraeota bacterium]
MTNHQRIATVAMAAAAIVIPNAANAASIFERFLSSATAANSRSEAIAFADVAKEVAPDTFQIDPRAVQGRRLALGAAEAGKRICVGAWRKGGCFGLYIEKDVP